MRHAAVETAHRRICRASSGIAIAITIAIGVRNAHERLNLAKDTLIARSKEPATLPANSAGRKFSVLFA
jgi:hypothetical protein